MRPEWYELEDRGGGILLLVLTVAMMVWAMVRNEWKDRQSGGPADAEYDERQRQIRLKGARLTMWTLETYLVAWMCLAGFRLADWANDVMVMASGGIVLSLLVFAGYNQCRGAGMDTDRRKFPVHTAATAAMVWMWTASRWIKRTHEVKMWELHLQLWGEEEAGPPPAAVDGFACILTVWAVGMAVLAVIALWQWIREKRGRAEEP